MPSHTKSERSKKGRKSLTSNSASKATRSQPSTRESEFAEIERKADLFFRGSREQERLRLKARFPELGEGELANLAQSIFAKDEDKFGIETGTSGGKSNKFRDQGFFKRGTTEERIQRATSSQKDDVARQRAGVPARQRPGATAPEDLPAGPADRTDEEREQLEEFKEERAAEGTKKRRTAAARSRRGARTDTGRVASRLGLANVGGRLAFLAKAGGRGRLLS